MDWTYKSGANGSTTALISTYTNGSDARYNYNYDANGNITQIWRGSVTFANASEKYSYVYDAANQLIRENLYYGTGNSNNATITYQYDSWGNLLYKRTYAYTTGTLGTVQETVTYTYGNSSWKDQLTSYNGQSITYDASGNPTSYLGAALVWEGQRLKSYTPASTGSGRVNAYTYNYDENGIRTRKTVGNTVTDYYYNGSLLIGIVQTTTNSDGSTETSIQRFSYDANGQVIAVNYNGTYYYYLRNAQGDVVKLIDKTGSTVVEYTYDSWGKPLSTTGSLAETFGAEQPFRYRGYVYDEETGFYYLQSRYYNPEVGRFISADVYLSTGQGVLGHNSYAYCLNNPVNSCDPAGLWSWGGFLTGLAIAVVGVVCVAACVASAGTLTPLVAVGVATASTALVTTGVTMSYAAATDSTMVMDLSCSYSINNCYAKIGVSCVIDFSDQRGELYPHIGGGIGKQVGLTYSVGLVENYNNAGDYAGSFIDASVGKHIGVDHCFSPDKHYSNTVKATSIVFSAVSESISWGGGYDYYFQPITIF